MASDCNTWLICESSSRELKAAQQSCSRSQSITVRWIVQVVIVTLKHTHTHAHTHTDWAWTLSIQTSKFHTSSTSMRLNTISNMAVWIACH